MNRSARKTAVYSDRPANIAIKAPHPCQLKEDFSSGLHNLAKRHRRNDAHRANHRTQRARDTH